MWFVVTVLGVPVGGPYRDESDAVTECWRIRRKEAGPGGSVDLRRFRVVKLLREPGPSAPKMYVRGEVPEHEAFVSQAAGLCIVVRHEDGMLEVCA